MEQETLEEAAERLYPVVIKPILDVYDDGVSNQIDEEDINEDSRESFIEGAKWKQEQDKNNEKELYSEIEYLIINWSNDGTETAGALTRQIIEQFKKK